MAGSVSRRDFARLFAAGGSAALFADPAWARMVPQAPAFAPGNAARGGEAYWKSVREQFVMPPDLAVMNSANLCPASRPVLEALQAETSSVDKDPSQQNRTKYPGAKEETRRRLAEFLRVTPEEIIITRNTSEANNLVSNGVDLKAGDEVIIFADNHPCNHLAWTEKARRFGFKVVIIPQVNPHPGMEHYVDAYTKAITARTKLISMTHLTSTVGDLMPVNELCKLAHDRGILAMVDGAQTFGNFDVDLSVMQPDFYSGSAHKWPCSSREAGLLYINKRSHDKIWPSIYSAYPGGIGLSRTFEGFGQRDDATHVAFGEALAFQTKVGRADIEQRSRGLARQIIAGLSKIPDVKIWTSSNPSLNGSVVSFLPGNLNPQRLATALYQKERIGITTRGGEDRSGIRVSPHFFNSPEEADRFVSAVGKYMKAGV